MVFVLIRALTIDRDDPNILQSALQSLKQTFNISTVYRLTSKSNVSLELCMRIGS